MRTLLTFVVLTALACLWTTSATAQTRGAAPNLTRALACAHDAIGSQAGAVTSLRIVSEAHAVPGVTGPQPADRDTAIVFPDRFKTTMVSTSPSGALLPVSILGFSGTALLSSMGGRVVPGDPAVPLLTAQQEFARYLLMFLVRVSPAIGTTFSAPALRRDGANERLALDAAGPGAFKATMLLDAGTCRATALVYERPTSIADRLRTAPPDSSSGSMSVGMVAKSIRPGSMTAVRIDLGDYRPFGGLTFPTVLKTSFDGKAYTEERVTDVQVNPALPRNYFAAAP
jgi:hypothetical protein